MDHQIFKYYWKVGSYKSCSTSNPYFLCYQPSQLQKHSYNNYKIFKETSFGVTQEETRRKWPFMSQEKICRPKNLGGLGLEDQEILSKVLGAKLQWRQVQNLETQWENISKEKYASSLQAKDLIRMSGNIKGSYIQNKAWENRRLVQENSFWEIREGDLALFWEDRWQQEPLC